MRGSVATFLKIFLNKLGHGSTDVFVFASACVKYEGMIWASCE